MNNIKTKEDVLGWAKIIVDGKGEKYIPLGKADMFAIAKYVAYGYGNLTEDLEVKVDMPPPTDSGGPAVTKVTMTRGYALHRAGFTTQQAYDKFLAWSKEHPKEGMVMDFSTGVKSTNAAFAYWLMENIEVEVPTYEMRAIN